MSNPMLNLAKQSADARDMLMPNSQALKDGMSLCTSEAAAQYMYDRAVERFSQARVLGQDAYLQVVDVLQQLVAYRKLADERSDIWGGQPVTTEFQKVQSHLAAGILDNITISKPMRFDFAVSNQGQLISVFTAEDARLDTDDETAMNKELIAWLATHNLIHQDGIVYEATDKGDIKQRDGKPVTVSPETLTAQLENQNTGFTAHLKKLNQSINVEVHSHDYDEAEPAEKPTTPSGGEK